MAGWSIALIELGVLLIVTAGGSWDEAPAPVNMATVAGATVAGATKRIYIVRHGEKFAAGSDAQPFGYDYACLSEKGWARAYNLKSVFGPHGWLHTPDALFSANYLDTAECRDEHGWYRTQQTISALAHTPGGLGLPIDNSTGWMPELCGAKVHPSAAWAKGGVPAELVSDDGTCFPYGKCGGVMWDGSHGCDVPDSGICCNRAAADAMLAKLAQPGVSTILVAWESLNTQWLARALGVGAAEVHRWDYTRSEFDRIYALHYDENLRLLKFEDDLLQGFDQLGSAAPRDALRWLGPQAGCGKVQVRGRPGEVAHDR